MPILLLFLHVQLQYVHTYINIESHLQYFVTWRSFHEII